MYLYLLYLVIHRCEYYNDNKMLPVFRKSSTREHYSIETLAKLLLDTDSSVAKGKRAVCSTQPVQVCHNASFLVDLNSLADAMDIRADENGVWLRKGSPVTYVSIHKNGSSIAVHKRSKLGSHAHHYKITRVYYRHSSSPDFTRIITTVNGTYYVAQCAYTVPTFYSLVYIGCNLIMCGPCPVPGCSS